ncbi:MAG: ATP-binding cassette domain-containing protein [Acidobacteriota bacterium]
MLRIVHVELPLGEFPLFAHLDMESRVTAIVGPSGAGKTSLLETIAGFLTPRRGRIELDGEILLDAEAGRNVPPRARRVGYVPQDDTLFPHRTVRRNLTYASDAGRDSPAGEFDRVVAVLELEPLLERGISKLSGGERRRVAVGRALLSHPRLLLCDEPLAGLHPELKVRILSYLKRVREEFSIPMLYVAHDAAEVAMLADEVVALERGAVVGRGAAKSFAWSEGMNIRTARRPEPSAQP